jgi:5'(3')-deoxyribonucleotidase
MILNRSKQTIAIDIDDVIANTTEALRVRVNERVGVNLQPEHYQVKGEYWGYYTRVWHAHGLAEKVHYGDIVQEMSDDQSYVPLLPGAALAIDELAKKFNLILITARESSWEVATRQWIDAHLTGKFIELYFMANHHDATAKNKGQLCRELGASWLIDDNAEHCQAAINEGIQAVLFGNYGWQLLIPKAAVRCMDWPAVVEYFCEK